MNGEKKTLLSLPEVAAEYPELGSLTHLYRLARAGQLPGLVRLLGDRPGSVRRLRVKRAVIDRWLVAQEDANQVSGDAGTAA